MQNRQQKPQRYGGTTANHLRLALRISIGGRNAAETLPNLVSDDGVFVMNPVLAATATSRQGVHLCLLNAV
jgi:hypothetical protein